MNPVDLIKLCFDDEIMNYICHETEKYASQKGESQFVVTVKELYRYFGILLLSGYKKMLGIQKNSKKCTGKQDLMQTTF